MNQHSLYTLGIDQGTTQTTAVVLDGAGALVAKNSVEVPIQFPRPGWVEQNPHDILKTVQEAVTPLLKSYPIQAFGFDNQGETFLLWDKVTGQPVTPAIVWQDKRGAEICSQLAQDIDKMWLREKTGLLLDSYFSAPKLRYVFQEEPDLRKAAEQGNILFGTTETWVLWKLTGGQLHITDPSTASRTLLFNMHTFDWDEDLLKLFDIPRSLLPDIQPSASLHGDVPFADGMTLPLYGLLVDQQAALFGQACFQQGDVKCTFGTGSFLLMNIGDTPQLSNQGLLTTVAWELVGRRSYALDGGIFVTGAAVQWLVESLNFLSTPQESADVAEQSKSAAVVVVPALAGLAAPYWKSEVRGAMFGLTRATSPADIVRATLEGIAHRVYEVVQAMIADTDLTPPYLKVDGGISANPYVMQYLADILNVEIQVAKAHESTAIGMANLARHTAFGISLDELRSQWQAETTYQPQMPEHKRETRLARWQQAIASVQHFHSNEVNPNG